MSDEEKNKQGENALAYYSPQWETAKKVLNGWDEKGKSIERKCLTSILTFKNVAPLSAVENLEKIS